MPLTHEDVKQIKTAKAAARAAGMFVVEKPGKFLLYRVLVPENELVGWRRNPAALARLISKASQTRART